MQSNQASNRSAGDYYLSFRTLSTISAGASNTFTLGNNTSRTLLLRGMRLFFKDTLETALIQMKSPEDNSDVFSNNTQICAVGARQNLPTGPSLYLAFRRPFEMANGRSFDVTITAVLQIAANELSGTFYCDKV